MVDFFEGLTGSAGQYMGQVGDYSIGAQPEPMYTTPAAGPQYFTPTETGYTPTFNFDFTSFLPSYGQPPAGYQAPQISYFGATQPSIADLPALGGFEAAKAKPRGLGAFTIPPGDPYTTYSPVSGAARRVSPPEVGGQVISPEQAAAPADTGVFGLKGLSTGDILKAVLGIGGGLMGMQAQQKAAEEAAAARREFQAASEKAAQDVRDLAKPYLAQGGAALSTAAQGGLSPAEQQLYQAGQARLAQEAARTGGVGAIQTQQALQRMYQQGIQNTQNMALQLLGPGNELAYRAVMENMRGTQGGLQMELQLAQAANQASMNMYGALASMIGGTRSAA